MPYDHSEVVPLLPIPNRTVKRLCADDSADSRVKVGHRQAVIATKARQKCRAFCFCANAFDVSAVRRCAALLIACALRRCAPSLREAMRPTLAVLIPDGN